MTGLQNLKNEFHWKEYGRNYSGVAIEFEILPTVKSKHDFYLSNIFYSDIEYQRELKEKWLEIHNILSLSNHYIQIDLNPLFCLHKYATIKIGDKISEFHKEEEVRFLFTGKMMRMISHRAYERMVHEEDKQNKIKYFELPLCNNEWEFLCPTDEKIIWEKLPKVRISNVYPGKKLSGSKRAEIDGLLKYLNN